MNLQNAYIQSVCARAILDLSFLNKLGNKKTAALKENPFRDYSSAHNLNALRLFSAFIAKVQHNYLWNDFPLTIASLKRSGKELAVFSAYLELHQQNKRIPGLPVEEKKQRFVCFLQRFLEENKQDHSCRLTSEILLFENTSRLLKRSPVSPVLKNKSGYRGRGLLKTIPFVNGNIKICAHAVNPALLNSILNSASAAPVPFRKKTFCYWYNKEKDELRIFEISKQVGLLLSIIDSEKNISAIRALTLISGKLSLGNLKDIIQALVHEGIVSYR